MTNPIPLLADWSAADREWLDTRVPVHIRHVALRYSRGLFSLVMDVGLSSACVAALSQCTPASHRQQLRLLAQVVNVLAQQAFDAGGYAQETYDACKADIELIERLTVDNGPSSPSGIILNS